MGSRQTGPDGSLDGRGQWPGFVHNESSKDLQRLIAGDLGVMDNPGRNRIGIARLQTQRRFAVDQEVGFALENISGLDSGMGVPPGRTAGADFGEAGDRQVALGKFDFLQWRAFDALCKRRARAQCDDAPKAILG